MITQKEITLPAYSKGLYIIDRIIENALGNLPEKGLLHIFIKHTSAGLTINENADPSVRDDFRGFLDKLIPENDPVYTHTLEGADDMPAHLKSSLLGNGVTIPLTSGKMNLGTWQGIYLCEFRNHGGPRKIVMTVYS